MVHDKSTRELGRGLTHLFTLLAVVYEHEPLRLAFAALASENESLRGTGLEYIEHVLPPELYGRLLPLCENRTVARKSRRARNEVLRELEQSKDSLVLPAAALAPLQSEPPPK